MCEGCGVLDSYCPLLSEVESFAHFHGVGGATMCFYMIELYVCEGVSARDGEGVSATGVRFR